VTLRGVERERLSWEKRASKVFRLTDGRKEKETISPPEKKKGRRGGKGKVHNLQLEKTDTLPSSKKKKRQRTNLFREGKKRVRANKGDHLPGENLKGE